MSRILRLFLVVILVVFAGCRPHKPLTLTGQKSMAGLQKSQIHMASLAPGGGVINLNDFRGKVILIDFWATWCPPCRSELPELNRLYLGLKNKGFVILGATVDRGSPDKIAQAVKTFNLQYPVGLAGSDVQRHFGTIRAVPTKFLMDKKGIVRKRYVGVVDSDKLRADIKRLLSE